MFGPDFGIPPNIQSIDRMQRRFSEAIREKIDGEGVRVGTVLSPMDSQRHTFDFDDGFRLVVARVEGMLTGIDESRKHLVLVGCIHDTRMVIYDRIAFPMYMGDLVPLFRETISHYAMISHHMPEREMIAVSSFPLPECGEGMNMMCIALYLD